MGTNTERSPIIAIPRGVAWSIALAAIAIIGSGSASWIVTNWEADRHERFISLQAQEADSRRIFNARSDLWSEISTQGRLVVLARQDVTDQTLDWAFHLLRAESGIEPISDLGLSVGVAAQNAWIRYNTERANLMGNLARISTLFGPDASALASQAVFLLTDPRSPDVHWWELRDSDASVILNGEIFSSTGVNLTKMYSERRKDPVFLDVMDRFLKSVSTELFSDNVQSPMPLS